jgi:hypothetical protein
VNVILVMTVQVMQARPYRIMGIQT